MTATSKKYISKVKYIEQGTSQMIIKVYIYYINYTFFFFASVIREV